MVKLVAVQKPLIHWLMKMAGAVPHTVQIEAGTVMNIWVPREQKPTTLDDLGFSSSSELLLQTSVKGCKALLKVATYKNLWFPDRLHRDFLEVMFSNRKERAELLEGLVVISTKETSIPNMINNIKHLHFLQRIHLLWGEEDQIFKLELAQNMKENFVEQVTFEGIKKAGLGHLERPCVYNTCLNKFLASHQQPTK
ncbi:uncharacterized protein LOC121803732 [Salvia splendens]|uniref:uncharacterized protein LOC121803732 n=1 Tax=Salvia splendens TaxID=180675 RepID=UPI001C27F368|nr:uncharacterized protein LOC121803732 [Salvia splendens]